MTTQCVVRADEVIPPGGGSEACDAVVNKGPVDL